MKYIPLFILLTFKLSAQQTIVKVAPSKDTTVVTFKAVTTTTSTYQTSAIPVKQDTVTTPPPPPTSGIEGFGKTGGGSGFAPTYVSTASAISAAMRSNMNVVITKGGTYSIPIKLSNVSGLTIDGTQADGPVIFNSNSGGIIFETCHDIVVKGVAVRNTGDDCAAANDNSYRIVFDHCAFTSGGDGSVDITNSHNVTIQWCVIGNSTSGASLIDYPGAYSVSIHHNLYVNSFERNPLIGSQQKAGRSDLICDFTNNVVYNWKNYGTDVNNNGTANVRNNFYQSTSNPGSAVLTAKNSYGTYPQGYAYVNGNVSGNGINTDQQSNHALWPVLDDYVVIMQDACTAAKMVLANAGPPKKDAVIQNLINSVSLNGCK